MKLSDLTQGGARRLVALAVLGASSLLSATGHAAFICDVDGYEAAGRFLAQMQEARAFYDAGVGLGHYGSPEIHERLRQQASGLQLDPERTPIVNADFVGGRVSVYYCAAATCTGDELAVTSVRACMAELGAAACRTYAVRVNGALLCTVAPSLQGR